MSEHRLYRSREDRMIAGVLGGLSEYFEFDPSWIRIGYVIITMLTGFFPGILLYLLMAIIIPRRPRASTAERTEVEERVP
jgi:phage shock protein C